ncbi:hypothetical protein PI2015_2922 [Pseudoalteromonas issachenkonii]|nr:hypothetical protein PI2015_2922 [Pseudoalteromonas issachenkonii]
MSQEKYRFQLLGARLQAEQSGINLIIVAWVELYETREQKTRLWAALYIEVSLSYIFLN